MTRSISDRWLWLGLGAFIVVAARGISYGLHDIVQLTKVTREAAPLDQTAQDPEDFISLDALEILVSSTNPDIRQAATKIVLDRFMRSPEVQKALLSDILSPTPQTHERALQSLRFLDDNDSLPTHLRQFLRSADAGPLRDSASFSQQIPVRARRLESRRSARRNNRSAEEEALRRRRREAMVLNEGHRPVQQGDIIQRLRDPSVSE
ncbi:hypothetical protein BJ546DRAFT_1057804 [Cryomyces antarcticus]